LAQILGAGTGLGTSMAIDAADAAIVGTASTVGTHAAGAAASAARASTVTLSETTAPTVTSSAVQSDTLAQQLAAQAQQRRLRKRRQPARAKCGAQAPGWVAAPTASSAQRAGMQAEDRVCQYLQSQGVRVLARNVQAKSGEIDVVCVDAGVLAFVEVRLRSDTRYGGAVASVGRAKQLRLIRTAQAWLPRLAARHFNGDIPPCRFDVVAVQGDAIAWLKQAFGLSS